MVIEAETPRGEDVVEWAGTESVEGEGKEVADGGGWDVVSSVWVEPLYSDLTVIIVVDGRNGRIGPEGSGILRRRKRGERRVCDN